MNDRYLYRAKRCDTGEWVEGFYAVARDRKGLTQHNILIADNDLGYFKWIVVDPSTICQCIGMPDKNSKVAYEHDIIETPVGNAKIAWSCSKSPTDNHINVGFEVVFLDAIANDNYRNDLGYWIGKSEVIGNIFDNQELLEVGE